MMKLYLLHCYRDELLTCYSSRLYRARQVNVAHNDTTENGAMRICVFGEQYDSDS